MLKGFNKLKISDPTTTRKTDANTNPAPAKKDVDDEGGEGKIGKYDYLCIIINI